MSDLESVHLDGLVIEAETTLLVGEKLSDFGALIALELDHLAHLTVANDGAIASKLLLDDFEDLLVVELARDTLNSGQSLASITLLNTDMNVFLGLLGGLARVLVGFGEGIVGLEVFDFGGHKLEVFGVSLGNGFC